MSGERFTKQDQVRNGGASNEAERAMPAWLRGPAWRRWLIIAGLFLFGWSVLFGGWIAVAMLRDSTDKDAGAVAFNIVLVIFMATVMFFTLQRGLYRWFWHVDRHRSSGRLDAGDRSLRFGAVRTPPPPAVRWPWKLRLRHLALLGIGMATLLFIFLPYENQLAIGRFVTHNSSGSASAGSLSMLLFAWLPLLLLVLLSMLLLSREMRRRDAGLLDDEAKLLLSAEMKWLFAFATAFAMTMLLCRMLGSVVVRHL